jgi:hypothetical protein
LVPPLIWTVQIWNLNSWLRKRPEQCPVNNNFAMIRVLFLATKFFVGSLNTQQSLVDVCTVGRFSSNLSYIMGLIIWTLLQMIRPQVYSTHGSWVESQQKFNKKIQNISLHSFDLKKHIFRPFLPKVAVFSIATVSFHDI